LLANALLTYFFHKLWAFPYPKIGNGHIFTISHIYWVNRIIGHNAKLYFFPLSYVDRFNLFIILFGGETLVFFIRRWSIKWNEQIKKGQIPNGDNIDKKVRMVTQLLFSVIPFINFVAFARICYFQRALIIEIPTYISMVFVTNAIIQNNSSLFYPVI
jgi:hypothetical protein